MKPPATVTVKVSDEVRGALNQRAREKHTTVDIILREILGLASEFVLIPSGYGAGYAPLRMSALREDNLRHLEKDTLLSISEIKKWPVEDATAVKLESESGRPGCCCSWTKFYASPNKIEWDRPTPKHQRAPPDRVAVCTNCYDIFILRPDDTATSKRKSVSGVANGAL